MKISEINLSKYRNLEESRLNFSPGVNFIYGKNAQGKTNLLEAIWMFTGARSFRGTKDADIINFKEDSAKLQGKFFFEKREQEISIFFSGGKRKAFLNGVAKPYPTSIIGKFRVVLFSPMNLSLITGGPEGRRKFLDAAICQLKPTYITYVSRYNQILRHRNALLKNISHGGDYDLLEVLDENLSEIGSSVILERVKYLKYLKEQALNIYSEISGKTEILEINYVSEILRKIKSSENDVIISEIKEKLKQKLEKSKDSDIRSGSTSTGPHKDDLEIFINEKKVRNFGSQGQQRSAALCLKLSEAAVLEEKIGESPVILLDDVMSELDDDRKNYMINKITNKQVFITNCDSSVCKKFENGKLFQVEKGKILDICEF